MTTTKTKRTVKVEFPLDPDLEAALDDARREDRSTRTGFIRNLLLRELRAGGFLSKPGRTMEAGR